MGAYDKGEGRGLLVEYTAGHMKGVFPYTRCEDRSSLHSVA